jgi:GMP synthase-like glutamine amidotransferase
MARIIVFQHSPHGTPGRLGMTLRDHGFRLDIRRLDQPEPAGGWIPGDLDNVHGVISLGGPQNVDESHPWMERELAFLRRAHEAMLPVLGICLGCQLIAKALGGRVERMESPEVGMMPVKVTVPGQTDTLMAGLPWTHMQFQSHGCQVVEPPAGASVLASSERCRVQVFRCGMRTVGIQFHPECDRGMIERFESSPDSMASKAGLSSDALSRQVEEHYAAYARLSDRLCVNLASWCFPFQSLLAV